jgi:hypothetical protein
VSVFYADRKSKMATTAIHRLTLDPMGKCSNAFFSETTNIMSDSPTLYSRWLLLLKIEMSSIVHCCFIINGLKFNCSLCHMDMNSLTYFAGFSLKFFIRPIYVDYANLNLLLWNCWTKLSQIWLGWSLCGPLSKLCLTAPHLR